MEYCVYHTLISLYEIIIGNRQDESKIKLSIAHIHD